jgi:hypothetical protein
MSEITPTTGSLEEMHTPCTKATVTVCPTPSLDPSTTDPQPVAPTVLCSDMASIQAMGAVIGIFVALLMVMTSGYIYICWNNVKKRGGLRIISKQIAR